MNLRFLQGLLVEASLHARKGSTFAVEHFEDDGVSEAFVALTVKSDQESVQIYLTPAEARAIAEKLAKS